MRHIKEKYEMPCNYIESSIEEFYILKDFLELYGVEARMCSAYGDTCVWQIRNGYKDWAHLYRNNQITGSNIINIVEENIKKGCYSR